MKNAQLADLLRPADFDGIVNHVVNDGIIASLSDSWNVGILIFLVVLGIIVALMNITGGSKAFGHWALKHVRSRVAAQMATMILGVVLFAVGFVVSYLLVRFERKKNAEAAAQESVE